MSVAGLKLQITSDELRDLVQARVDYHHRKFELFSKADSDIKGALDEFEDEAEVQNKYSNSTVSDLKSKAKHHRDRATYFRFMAAHVIPNETYVLDENDLRRIEVLGGNW